VPLPTPVATEAPDELNPAPSASMPPDVAALYAKVEAAAGKRPARERIVETIDAHGRTATQTTLRDGRNRRTTLVDGPFESASGTFDGQRWHQNANGMTVLDQPRRGVEAMERRTLSLRRVETPIVADVIANLDPRGHGTRTFVDPATERIVRYERIMPAQTVVTTYGDFRTTDGYTQAWLATTTDPGARGIEVARTVSITHDVAASSLAVPSPRRQLVEFPAGVTTTRLPVKLVDEQWIVRVQVGSRGLDFLIDTGDASGITIDESVARSLQLHLFDDGVNAGNVGRFEEYKAIVPDMRVGALDMRDVAVNTTPNLSFEHSTSKVVGLLGFDFIASEALAFDYDDAAITATDYDSFKPPTASNVVALPIRVGGQGPEVDVAIDGHIGERFEIDTGAFGGLLITDGFTRRYPGITRGFHSLDRTVTMQGVGGTTAATLYTIPSVRLGSVDFTNFAGVVLPSDRTYGASDWDGVLGPEILQYFTMTTDYADSTIYLEPNSHRNLHFDFGGGF